MHWLLFMIQRKSLWAIGKNRAKINLCYEFLSKPSHQMHMEILTIAKQQKLGSFICYQYKKYRSKNSCSGMVRLEGLEPPTY